jgi:hypothetical protein
MSKATSEAASVAGVAKAGLSGALQAASERAQQGHEKSVRDKLIKLHGDTYSSAAAYDKGVIVAGYVAFFGLWAGAANDVSHLCRLVTVALMGTSLLCYMAWHILQMLTRQRFEFQFASVFEEAENPEVFNRAYAETQERMTVAMAKLMKFWPWVFIPAVGFGFLGGGVLTYNALAAVFGWPQLAN